MVAISLWAGADASSVDDVVERVRAAAADGLRSVWLPQTASVDALTALAVAAREVPDVALGTAVVPIQGRHPVPLALQALTVADAAGPGRFTLGVGVTHKMVSESWFGVPYRDVVQLCAEELEALQGLLSPKRSAAVNGSLIRTHMTVALDVDPPGLVVAALGPKMLALTGRFADGTVTWMTGHRTLAERVVPQLREAAADAGRPDPRVVVGLPVCVTDEPDDARRRLLPAMVGAAQMPSYRRMLEWEGVDQPTDIAIVGDEAAVRDQIEQLGAVGTTELLANVVGTDAERRRTRELLASLG